MTKKNNVSKAKFLFTVVHILLFLGVMVYADVFGTSSQEEIYVNPNFIGTEEKTVEINPDNINITIDGEEAPIVHYIIQPGDSLEKISKEFGVTVKDLKKLNKDSAKLRPGKKLIISSNEEGILYIIKKERSLKLFSEFYRLDKEELMTLNAISDDSEMLYPGQQIFINITENRAYDVGLLEKAQPILPKDELPKKKIQPKKTNTSAKGENNKGINNNYQEGQAQAGKKGSKVLRQKYFNKKITNGFAVGYCTWYVAIKTPSIFKYVDENKQERPFGGNAKDRYANASKAGFAVGKNPRVGAIIVYERLRSYAGHVGIVRSYDPASGEMIIEDMNYAGKYIVTQRKESANRAGITGYIYP